MGLARGEFWWRISRFNWFGHQSRFDRAPAAVCRCVPFITGDLLSVVIVPPTRLPRRALSARSDERMTPLGAAPSRAQRRSTRRARQTQAFNAVSSKVMYMSGVLLSRDPCRKPADLREYREARDASSGHIGRGRLVPLVEIAL